MSKKINIDKISCYLLLILVVLYFSQGVLTPKEGIGQILLLAICAISLVYLFKMTLVKNKFNSFMKVWILFMCMNLFAFLFYADHGEFEIIKGVLLNFFPFFAFYYFSEKNILTSNLLIAVFLIFLPVFVIKLSQSLITLRLERNRDDVVDNTIYLFIGLLPFVFFFKKKVFSLAFLLVLWYFMVQSAKRAAIICGAIAIVLFVVQNVYNSKGEAKVKQYIISIILFVVISYFGYDLYQKNQFLMDRMQSMAEGDSSGRDNLLSNIFHAWYQSDNIFNYLFGFGYNSSRTFSGMASHNDWADMLISFGLIGLLMYFTLHRLLFLQIIQKNCAKDKRIVLILVFCIVLITSTTSRWYWSTFAYMQMLVLPYLLATKEKKII